MYDTIIFIFISNRCDWIFFVFSISSMHQNYTVYLWGASTSPRSSWMLCGCGSVAAAAVLWLELELERAYVPRLGQASRTHTHRGCSCRAVAVAMAGRTHPHRGCSCRAVAVAMAGRTQPHRGCSCRAVALAMPASLSSFPSLMSWRGLRFSD